MVVYGTKAAKLIVEPISNTCPNCGVQHTMDIHVFQRYMHVFFIPFFPTRKTGASQCNHCRQVLRRKEMPADLLQTFNKVKSHTTMPVWTWSGVLVAAALAAYSVFWR